MPDVNLTVTPPVAPLVTVTPASVFVSLGNVVGAVGSGTSQFSIQGTGAPGNPYQLVGDSASPGTWKFYGTNGSGTLGYLAQGATTQFSIIGNGVSGTPLQLSGDTATPGNNVFYGTNPSGVLGYYTPPVANATTAGYVPTPPNNTTTFLRGDATFAAVTGGAQTLVATNLGTITTNQTVNCAGACAVHIKATISASVTITLNNLIAGVPLSLIITSTGTFTVKLSATDPSSVAYAMNSTNNSGTTVNLVSTGINLTSGMAIAIVGNSCYVSGTPTFDSAGA